MLIISLFHGAGAGAGAGGGRSAPGSVLPCQFSGRAAWVSTRGSGGVRRRRCPGLGRYDHKLLNQLVASYEKSCWYFDRNCVEFLDQFVSQ